MKFDLHCHTKEGSIDAKVGIKEYAKMLIHMGYDGMLITDHNSYKGYDYYVKNKRKFQFEKPFVILKGIEYDTLDGGHMIVVMPDHVESHVLENRGMTTRDLVTYVHALGGIVGPAHPYGNGFFAYMHTKAARKAYKAGKQFTEFDFIETFNSCTHPTANAKAALLAKRYKKPAFAGTDAHRRGVIGSAYTIFPYRIETNDDLIKAVRHHVTTAVTTEPIPGVFAAQHWPVKDLLIWGYYFYNKIGALSKTKARRKHINFITLR